MNAAATAPATDISFLMTAPLGIEQNASRWVPLTEGIENVGREKEHWKDIGTDHPEKRPGPFANTAALREQRLRAPSERSRIVFFFFSSLACLGR